MHQSTGFMNAASTSGSNQQLSHQAALNAMKNLTGEENVSVINKLTGKRISGSKAPQLKRLSQWLNENPGSLFFYVYALKQLLFRFILSKILSCTNIQENIFVCFFFD